MSTLAVTVILTVPGVVGADAAMVQLTTEEHDGSPSPAQAAYLSFSISFFFSLFFESFAFNG